MSNNKIKHLSVWIGWLALHAYLFYFRMSWGGLAVLVIGAALLFCLTFCNDKYEYGYMYQTMGHVLGTSLMVYMGWYVVGSILPPILEQSEPLAYAALGAWECITSMVSWLWNYPSLLIPLCIAIVLCIVRFAAREYPFISMMASYLSTCSLMIGYLNQVYDSPALVVLCLLMTLICIYVDMWPISEEGEWNTNTKWWIDILSVLLFILVSWDTAILEPLTDFAFLERVFVLKATKWPHLLVMTLLFAGLMIVHICKDPGGTENGIDIKHCITALCTLYVVLLLRIFHVGYWWILVLIYIVYQMIDAMLIAPVLYGEDDLKKGIVAQIVMAVICVLIALIGHFGLVWMVLSIVGGVAVMRMGCRLMPKHRRTPAMKNIAFLGISIAGAVVPIFVWMWQYRRLEYHLFLLVVFAVACIGIIHLFSFRAFQYEKSWLQYLPALVAAIAFLAVSINMCASNGSRIKIEQDSAGYLTVTAEARGDDNRVVYTACYWTKDWLDLEDMSVRVEEEHRVYAPGQLHGEDGKLRVAVTDQYGIVTEKIYWVHVSPDTEGE